MEPKIPVRLAMIGTMQSKNEPAKKIPERHKCPAELGFLRFTYFRCETKSRALVSHTIIRL